MQGSTEFTRHVYTTRIFYKSLLLNCIHLYEGVLEQTLDHCCCFPAIMDTEELDKLRTQLIKGISKLHEIASSKRKPLAELGNKGCLRELERLRKRERELKEQNDRLNKALGLYKERRRKDREAVEQWTTYARELETANEQLLNDLRKSRDDVVDITPSSQVMLPTDSTCDEIDLEMSFHEEEVPIKQEPKSSRESRESDQRSDGTQIKQEPHSSPDYGRTESQLPQHLIPDSIDLEAPIYEVKSSQSDMELSSSAMDLTSSAIMVPSNVTMSITPVIPSKRAAKQPDFRSEIDQDLRSGERRVMFDQVEVQLPTPKTSSAQRRVTDHWLKRDLNRLSSDTPNTTETPTKLRATEADVKAPCDENRENESELLGSYNSNFTHKESLIERYAFWKDLLL